MYNIYTVGIILSRRISLGGDPDTLIQNLRSNHLHACYGSFVPELLDVCDLLDILPITV